MSHPLHQRLICFLYNDFRLLFLHLLLLFRSLRSLISVHWALKEWPNGKQIVLNPKDPQYSFTKSLSRSHVIHNSRLFWRVILNLPRHHPGKYLVCIQNCLITPYYAVIKTSVFEIIILSHSKELPFSSMNNPQFSISQNRKF